MRVLVDDGGASTGTPAWAIVGEDRSPYTNHHP
jgi:hypothetical protein